MRFHLTMFFMTVAVSMGMHAIASAAEPADAARCVACAVAPALAAPPAR